MFTDAELEFIGRLVGGTGPEIDEGGREIVYGSNTFPSHMIMVDAAKARAKLDELFSSVIDERGD